MQIDLNKLVSDLLPTWLRSSKMVRMLMVLLSQAREALNRYKLNISDWLYQINADSSVISLQHQIKRELDVDAVITELSGQPIDFLVTVNGFVDENRLMALIESRKLAGKSFVFKTGNMEYSAAWINHVCAQEYETISISASLNLNTVDITADSTVSSNISVSVRVHAGNRYKDYVAIILNGSTATSFTADVKDSSGNTLVADAVEILSLNPTRDYYNNYIIT